MNPVDGILYLLGRELRLALVVVAVLVGSAFALGWWLS